MSLSFLFLIKPVFNMKASLFLTHARKRFKSNKRERLKRNHFVPRADFMTPARSILTAYSTSHGFRAPARRMQIRT